MLEVFKKLITEFGKSIGIDDLAILENDDYLIGVDDYELNISLNGEMVFLSASFFTIPQEKENLYYARLVKGNFFLAETGGATLAVNPFNNEIQLVYAVNLKLLDLNTFNNVLEKYFNAVDHWKEVCKALTDDTSHAQDVDVMQQMQDGIRI